MATNDDLETFNFDVQSNESLSEQFVFEADGTPVDLTGGSFLMQIRQDGVGSTLLAELSTANGRIVILDQTVEDNLGRFDVDMSQADFRAAVFDTVGAGSYDYEILFTSAGGITERLYGGVVNVTRGLVE